MTLAHIAERMFDRPLLVEPRKAAVLARALAPRVLGGDVSIHLPAAADGIDVESHVARPFASILGDELGEAMRADRVRGYQVRNGVAIIPVTGTLVHRGAWLGSYSGETSYEGLSAQLRQAAADSSVKGIALEIDSFGGEVAGLFDFADAVRDVRAEKPVRAILAEFAFSAAYAIASQADRVTVPRTGGAGSIGVIGMHVDHSGKLSNEGLAVTLITSGAKKAAGNPFEPLPEDVREELKAEFDAIRALFAETVAVGRNGQISADEALATEAAVFRGRDAVTAGLADEVASPRASFEAFAAEVGGFSNTAGSPGRAAADVPATTGQQSMEDEMTDSPKAGAGQSAAPDKPALTLESLKADHPTLVAEIATAAASAERDRIKGCEEALMEGASDDVRAMVFDGKSTGADVALAIVKDAKAKGAEHMAGLKAAENDLSAVAAAPVATPSPGGAKAKPTGPDGWADEFNRSEKLQAEFASAEDYVAFKQAEANGRIRVLNTK